MEKAQALGLKFGYESGFLTAEFPPDAEPSERRGAAEKELIVNLGTYCLADLYEMAACHAREERGKDFAGTAVFIRELQRMGTFTGCDSSGRVRVEYANLDENRRSDHALHWTCPADDTIVLIATEKAPADIPSTARPWIEERVRLAMEHAERRGIVLRHDAGFTIADLPETGVAFQEPTTRSAALIRLAPHLPAIYPALAGMARAEGAAQFIGRVVYTGPRVGTFARFTGCGHFGMAQISYFDATLHSHITCSIRPEELLIIEGRDGEAWLERPAVPGVAAAPNPGLWRGLFRRAF